VLVPSLCCPPFQRISLLILCCHGFVVTGADDNHLLLFSGEVFAS